MSRFIFFCIILFFSCTLVFAGKPAGNFIALSDLHFNPFYACSKKSIHCPLIQELKKHPVSNWQSILEKYDTNSSVYGEDTNYPLFVSLLNKLHNITKDKKIDFVLLLGDLLAHDYKMQYQQYTQDASEAGAQAFVNKSMLFIVRKFNAALPTTDIYPTIGNNDVYETHYAYEPIFYRSMAAIWSQLIKTPNNRQAFLRTFPLSGYYQISLPKQPEHKIIILNSTPFSPNTNASTKVAEAQLDWLHQSLEDVALKKQAAFLIMHIPPSIDVYATIKSKQVVPLWQPLYLTAFNNELAIHPSSIRAIFASHLHADWLQELTLANHKLAVTGVPGISPQFGNNPAFKLYKYDTNSFQISTYQTYYLNLQESSLWQIAYDFKTVYQDQCNACSFVDGINQIQPNGPLAKAYQLYYSTFRNAQPITKDNKWYPYYWCAIHNNLIESYQTCLDK